MAEFILSCEYVVDLPVSYLKENNLNAILFNYSIDGVGYKDDGFQSISADEFYGMIKEGKEPVTSQVNAEEYTASLKKLLDEGKDVIHMCLSSGISGSYNSARIAVEQLKEDYPDRKIVAIDSLCASMGYGLLVHYAVKAKNEGKNFEETVEYIEGLRQNVHNWVAVEDLYHLKRGGRISGASAAVGTMLNIKPIIVVTKEGKLLSVDKIRGRKKSLQAIVAELEKRIENPDGQDIFISHSYCEEDAHYVEKLIKEKYPNIGEIMINPIGPVIGSHTGIGTIALFFVGAKRDI